MRRLCLILCALSGSVACDESTETDEPPPQEPAEGDEAPAPGETEPADEPGSVGPRVSPDGMCGGIAGFACPEGEWCDLEGDYPDASGTCRAEGECDDVGDCEAQDLVHVMCVGQWACEDGRCAWQCDQGDAP